MSSWLERKKTDIQETGPVGVKRAINDLWTYFLSEGVAPFAPNGKHIFDEEWDLLIILDACRYDLMEDVEDDYEFIGSLEKVWSVASSSVGWMTETFDNAHQDKISKTSIITANPYSDELINPNDVFYLDEVWTYGWDDDMSTTPADAVTDRTIEFLRGNNSKYTISHYMQPHASFVNYPDIKPENTTTESVWKSVLYGENSKSEIWEAYQDNLHYVLESIQVLLENVDAEKVVITADHGNALGEWWTYGHDGYVPIDAQRAVPWIQTHAEDKNTHTPETRHSSSTEPEVNDRLRQLGYVE
ncbi:sulfatase-like hydrolase/transferase [Haloarcula sp. 1CSR25-25]|uniref:sulfatase-like hydrolase/transferase n=1 Tax=Haloarcula sp. 1CSR25-25 TaxID=2862545 RepID=UPI0028953667|nr:sulfatase-like hydrolase/transferase [Haloarcula sp. 1CSR25-25]MDT3435560.1 sulfatase-like hydrolase/transferase [Haloarcula sp. 1CSR25-25]